VLLALTLGATFVARSFSGDKAQLVPLIQAGMRHNGFALIDVLSPCVTFNDHEGSTKSYGFTREHYHPVMETDFVPRAEEIAVDYAAGESIPVSLHDGSRVVLRKLDPSYDPTDRTAAYNYIENKLKVNEYVTGLIHIDEKDDTEFHNLNKTSAMPLNAIPFEKLSPGRAALDKLMGRYR
jgi:2-oxoglutarate/2-oxoacid ferredoxin oxidoreductase subunit beta